MSTNRKEIEEVWRQRMQDARLRLDFARNYLSEIQRDIQAGAIPAPDGAFAYRNAMKADSDALAEYARVLRIFSDLTLHGRLPDDQEEPPPSAGKATGGGDGSE